MHQTPGPATPHPSHPSHAPSPPRLTEISEFSNVWFIPPPPPCMLSCTLITVYGSCRWLMCMHTVPTTFQKSDQGQGQKNGGGCKGFYVTCPIALPMSLDTTLFNVQEASDIITFLRFLPNPGRILPVLTFYGLRSLDVNTGRIL